MRRLLALILMCGPLGAYSALTHEAIIDSVWISHIRPLLLWRFPNATPEELKEAHAYAYGGSQIQDVGYFPFASHEYSDYTHYLRSGDFVTALIRDAVTVDDFAFALGALAHYTSDHIGHPAVNRSTALIYPRLRRRFGSVVTYEDNPADHLKVEFSFDVVQVARGLYAPDAYHDFIGFQVSKPALEKAFQKTYGIELKEVFGTLDLGIETYRFTVGSVIPEMTKVAWASRRDDIRKLSPAVTRGKFVYELPRKQYRREWGKKYHEAGLFTRFLALLFRLIPTVGPFKVLSFKPVPATAEKDFLESFDRTVDQYKTALTAIRQGHLALSNYNLDTGELTRPGAYKLADKAYLHLLDRLARRHFVGVAPELRKSLLEFLNTNRATMRKKASSELQELERTP